MLIPLADVPRWYAERKPKDTIAISHGADTLTWSSSSATPTPARGAFAAKGVKPGDFRRHRADPTANAFFRDHVLRFGNAGRRRPSLDLAVAARRGRGGAGDSKTFAGGRWPAGLNAPNSLPADFLPDGFSTEPISNPVARYWKAMTSGGSTGRPKVILDHRPAVIEPTGRRRSACRSARRCSTPARSTTNAPFNRFAHRAVPRRARHRPRQIRRRGMPAPDRSEAGCSGSISCPP